MGDAGVQQKDEQAELVRRLLRWQLRGGGTEGVRAGTCATEV